MKIVSCYIENFGNIKHREFKFGRGLTSFCEQNGYGKTTLASFLKAMLYGLKQTRATDKELGERARFYPFDGGKFGGNVVIEKDGVVYKIERFFGRKSTSDDTLTVYADDGILQIDEVGKELFGLDEQSFMRTVFLNSADTESGATGDISRMLNGFVDDADFDAAQKILEKKQKFYKAGKGKGGAIDEKHEEVLRLKESIENKEKINSELSLKYSQRKELAEEVAVLEARGNALRDVNLLIQKWSTYDGILADAEAEREKLKSIVEKYPSLPDSEEIRELKRHAEALNLENVRRISATLSAEKAERLKVLSSRFAGGIPTEEEISSANGRASEGIRLDAEIANLENAVKDGADNKFAAGVPGDEEVKSYGEKLAAIREKKNVQPKKRGSVGKKIALLLAITAVICAGAGVAMMVLKEMLYGGIILGVGGALALGAIFAYFKGQISGMTAAATADSAETEPIKLFLARYGYYSDGGVEVDYNNLVRDLEIYKSETEQRERNEKLLAEKREEANRVKEEVVTFLEKYNFSGENAQADLTRLGALATEYVALNAEKEEVSARSNASKEEIDNHTKTAHDILNKYSIAWREDLGGLAAELERARGEVDRLNENIAKLEKRASDYMAENELKERPQESEDIQGLDYALSRKRDELSLLDREISDDESAVERLAELKEELDGAREEELALKRKYELIIRTRELLEKAEQNLKDRYISPVKNSFLSYRTLLERVLGEKVTFDKDFRIKYERGGEDRSDAHLSAGQKSLCALCLRLALIDNMYRDDKPFIIMDDPFVHLDEQHMVRAETLLKELARGRQIIYFCCHESRKI